MTGVPTGEMSEKNLEVLLTIFLPDGDWKTQGRFYYDPENRRKFYKVDCYSEKLTAVWEYEGPEHYCDVWKVRRDEERKVYLESNGYRFFRWPYYAQLTKDVAKYFFADAYSDKKYQQAINMIYGATDQSSVLAPGLHTSKNTPANFVGTGVRRFFSELNTLPKSIKAQVAESLRRYIADIGDPYLIIGEQEEFELLLQIPISDDELKVYFHRDPVNPPTRLTQTP